MISASVLWDTELFTRSRDYLQVAHFSRQLISFLEQLIGRKHSYRNGPRLIDIDIIMYGSSTVTTVDLQVPVSASSNSQ